MLNITLWQKIVILGLCLLGIALALPNAFYTRVEQHNDAVVEIAKSGETPALAAARDGWPSWLPSSLVNLGLDLRGGAHLLAEVQVQDVYKTRMDSTWVAARDALREVRAEVGAVRREPGPDDQLKIKIEKPEGMAKALEIVRGLAAPVVSLTGVGSSDIEVSAVGDVITVVLSEAERQATNDRTIQQSLEIIRRRVDEVGTREPTIQREGGDRILIQVPGVGSAQELKQIIGKTAKLTFHQVLSSASSKDSPVTAGEEVLPMKDQPNQFLVLDKIAVVSGDDLVDAQPTFNEAGAPAVSFRFNTAGARAFGTFTAEHVGEPFAIVLDGEIISAPSIREAIPGGQGIISGNFTVEESTNLAILLRAGALPAELIFVEERTIGPELGQDSIDAGRLAALIGMAAVAVYMVLSYSRFGVFAVVALSLNIMMLIAILSVIGATLTLPGIAGIVLTMGMAVDGNVLIFERIREELRDGKHPVRAVELGFQRAFSAIMDSNLTAIITGIIMFWLGSGPVRGFAITLMIGIVTSMFTAVYVTRLIVVMWLDRARPKELVV